MARQSNDSELPARYEAVRRLGRGGGGEVWAVRDRGSPRTYALKVLAKDGSEREMSALVREAVALSGLEGLGLPRVVRFGRLPQSGRPFLVREVVEGESLEAFVAGAGAIKETLRVLSSATDQLTVLHRYGLLHGDVKPGNIIFQPGGAVTFVDLGLSAPWREGGSTAEGLTPRYAAPELLQGGPLTVRAEVYAVGVILSEALEQGGDALGRETKRELELVAARATALDAGARYPSVDELGSAIRCALGERLPSAGESAPLLWPVVGIEAVSTQLLDRAQRLAPGAVLELAGPPGSGRSALARRLAWGLGALGRSVAWLDEPANGAAVLAELEAFDRPALGFVLIDDTEALGPEARAAVERARSLGARLVAVGHEQFLGAEVFSIPPLDEHACLELVRRAMPSLTLSLARRLVEQAAGRPGHLRALLAKLSTEAVASEGDFERALGTLPPGADPPPEAPLERASFFLERGRFNEATSALANVSEAEAKASPALSIARARLSLGLGEERQAFDRLASLLEEPGLDADLRKSARLFHARARIGLGDYAAALAELSLLSEETSALGVEALSYHGLARSLIGEHEEARRELERAVSLAQTHAYVRLQAVSLLSLGLVLQRADRSDEAREAYRAALGAAERASDASTLAIVQLNFAGLLKVRGDIASAIELFEAAADMGRRSGRRSTARQALLNLANTDLYLGRLARAESSIEALREHGAELPKVMQAQLLGLEAELFARRGERERAVLAFEACAEAYRALGRGLDAAEAWLEGILAAVRAPHPVVAPLRQRLEQAAELLRDAPAHRPLLHLAQARISRLLGDEVAAREQLDSALSAARDAAQREWLWRALEARAELEEEGGQPLLARRDREEALAVLEEIGARLPRDLREVYWNDPRRKSLRGSVAVAASHAATEFMPFGPLSALPSAAFPSSSISSPMSQTAGLTPLEQRLSRILEVNGDLAGEVDLERLTRKIIGHAIELLRAERGVVLLRADNGSLNVYASRSSLGDAAHEEFSRSIAERVLLTGEAVLTLDARADARMKSFASVHQMLLESVACVPILSPAGAAIGALYLETRVRPGSHFERELPTLRAFADQAAIALSSARLLGENRERADELARINAELELAQGRLRELLEGRTEQLKRARQKLRDARDTLYGHFGYQGLVGTSSAMRRVYAVVDRVKDTDVPVLITGESGTGKEVVARAIHGASARGKGKMLGVNCGAIPENLLETELFGCVRGAFTGADRDRRGLLREAEGGSILLDEIGEMPLKMQSGLLRVLQEKQVRPVGGSKEERVDARVLFATNRDLEQMVKDGRFREDLYYRIHVVEIRLPSLRERPDDIPQLVDYFLGLFAARYKRDKKSVSREALRRLQSFDWPGNVRQLEHVLLNAWVMSELDELEVDDFELPDGFQPPPPVVETRALTLLGKKSTASQHRRDERERILEALRSCNWNRVKAAELSGIPRRTFYRRLRDYGIQ